MRLKTKLVLAITGLVFAVVVFLSWIWLSQLLQQHIDQSWEATDILAHQISFAVNHAIDTGLRGRSFDSNDPAAVRTAVAAALRQDSGLNSQINAIVNYSPTILDIAIADRQNRAIIAVPDATQDDQLLPNRPDYSLLRRQPLIRSLQIVFGPPRVYNVSLGLDLNNQPFLTIRIGIRTTFLRNAFKPWLFESFSFMGLAMIISIVVAAFVANLALQPIEQISRRLDALTTHEAVAEAATASEGPRPGLSEVPGTLAAVLDPLRRGTDAVAQVSGKIERLGQRIRNVEEVFSALRENLDQILSNLQDGVMLFTRDARAVLVSSAVERFLNIARFLTATRASAASSVMHSRVACRSCRKR
jgi:PAS domain-containing protein